MAPVPDVYRGKHRDTDHPGRDMGEVYAAEVDTILDTIEAEGEGGPAAFFAESFQSCGGQIIFPDSYLSRVYSKVVIVSSHQRTFAQLRRRFLRASFLFQAPTNFFTICN